MDSEIIKLLNEEIMELKSMNKLAQQRLDLHREEFNKHSETIEKRSEVLERHSEMLECHSVEMDKISRTNDMTLRGLQILHERLSDGLNRLSGE